tara:strand:+ start:2166 stop:3566 length:1401 start_codon:yes stop_codon:yes gene_type:complete
MEAFDGLTLFTPFAQDEEISTYLIDNDSNVIHVWNQEYMPASMPYLLPDSSIIYPYQVEEPTMIAGGVGGGVKKILWDGTVLWDYTFSNSIYQHHHDVEVLPNGNILILAWEKKSISDAHSMGRSDIDLWTVPEMWSTAVLELNPESGEIEWEWHLWDHLVQDVDPSFGATYGDIASHPELFDINCGAVGNSAGGPQMPNGDWMHMNSIDYNPILDQIVLSSRLQSEFYIIDHSTTTEQAASHEGGNSGKGGDILYRWGNPENYQRGSSVDKILDSQHSVNWIPDGYPGEGNIILFNNFHQHHGSGMASAILEISPTLINDSYFIAENNSFGPENLEWEYISSTIVPMQGGAFRLPNGNTIVTFTQQAKIIEVDSFGNIAWEYVHDQDGEISWWIARSDKYSLDYLENAMLGDINSDESLDILDIVLMINMILDSQYSTVADVNEDEFLDILDVVVMVNILIGSIS